MSLHGVIGNPTVVAQLAQLASGRDIPHAILLIGAEQVGKTSIALEFAGAALDAARWPGGLPAHPDHWADDSPAERIGIDRIRPGERHELGASLQEFLSLRAYAGGRRVAVMARADRLTETAANCLLKTLEEPPPGATLLLTTAYPERLPATVVSRCRVLLCAPVSRAVIAGWLERDHGVPADIAATAANLAGGRPGRALRLATEPSALAREVEAIGSFLGAAGGGPAAALRAAAELAPSAGAEGRERALVQLAAWATLLRDVACMASGAPELLAWSGFRPAIERWAEALPRARITSLLERVLDATEAIASYAQPRLCYEVLFLEIFATPPAAPLVLPEERGSVTLPEIAATATRAAATTARPRRPRPG